MHPSLRPLPNYDHIKLKDNRSVTEIVQCIALRKKHRKFPYIILYIIFLILESLGEQYKSVYNIKVKRERGRQECHNNCK